MGFSSRLALGPGSSRPAALVLLLRLVAVAAVADGTTAGTANATKARLAAVELPAAPEALAKAEAAAENEEEEESEEERRRRLVALNATIIWEPPIDDEPAGGGPPTLYAGTNYTSWKIITDSPVTASGRLVMINTSIHYSGAQAGYCLADLYYILDKLPPLDASIVMPGTNNTVEYRGGIIFSQGGTVKLCWSPGGTFGIGDGHLVPQKESTYRIFGAFDTCQEGSGCLAARRFFCHLPHVEYLIYGPLGTLCEIFMQNTNTELVYSRLTWTDNTTTEDFNQMELEAGIADTPLRHIGSQCPGATVGAALYQSDKEWIRTVDPLSRITLGNTRTNLTRGFHYKICFCPSYDASTDGVCGELSDFVQQVGYLDGLMVSYLAAGGDSMGLVQSQVIAMTRFVLKVDCGDGPWCGTHGLQRIKVIPKSWDPVETDVDLPSWDDRNGCPAGVEVDAWHSPPNCVTNAGTRGQRTRLSSGCVLSGGTNPSTLLYQNIRFLPMFESGANVAQIFDVCFVHLPLEVTGIAPEDFNRTSDDALQNTTRTFWKVGQLVIEPLILLDPYSWVVNRPATIAVAPVMENRSSSLHDSFPEKAANGTRPQGPILKVVRETVGPIDNLLCSSSRPVTRELEGLVCVNSSWCSPRAVKVGQQLRLTGGDPDHRLTPRKAGYYAVCYCESWLGLSSSCVDSSEWFLVGKLITAGPMGDQYWVMDKGIVQSFTIEGFGFTDDQTVRDGRWGPWNVVRILKQGVLDCRDAASQEVLASTSVKVCSPRNKGRCQWHSIDNGVGLSSVNITDIPGTIWRSTSVYPPAVITDYVPDGDGNSILKFTQIAILERGDRIHLQDNFETHTSHWRRKMDLDRIVQGVGYGFEVIGVMDAGREVRIPMTLDPFPNLTINPPRAGGWWRSNKLTIPNIKGTEETPPLTVCWGVTDDINGEAQYYDAAGYVTFVQPSALSSLDISLAGNGAGSIVPMMIAFKTNDNPIYLEGRGPMQLRVSFTNTSVIAPAVSDSYSTPLVQNYDMDQSIEASQVVCGMLFKELASDHEFGFPVPRGCWVDFNRYGAEGRVVSVYMVFEPMNGLQALTRYTAVINVVLLQEVYNYTGLSDDPGLIEVATMDDIYVKPEGIVDISWGNPDVPIARQSVRGPSNPGGRFKEYEGSWGGLPLRLGARKESREDTTVPSDDYFVDVNDTDFGMVFLLKGDEQNPIQATSIIRIFLWPLTQWSLNVQKNCGAECIPQAGRACSSYVVCQHQATISACKDFVPPKEKLWRDTRMMDCSWYEGPSRCSLDGLSYTPANGYSAMFSCCACNGGIRFNGNLIKLYMPVTMDSASGNTVIHTVRVYKVVPMSKKGFFATRFGAQVTTGADKFPHYITTSGRYIIRTPDPSLYSPVATLVDADGWGNPRQFKGEPLLNFYYLRLTTPATLFGNTWLGAGYLTSMVIQLPEGFQCKMVMKADPVGDGDDKIVLPVFPELAPTGNGGLPPSTEYAGGNATTPGAGLISGRWSFKDNLCQFDFEPYMTLWENMRVYLRIFVLNPKDPLPRNDPRNFWMVNFTSSGASRAPYGLRDVCRPYWPPACNDTGETVFVNPLGTPSWGRSFDILFPNQTLLSRTLGPYPTSLPVNLSIEPNYTTSFAVLGILEEMVMQPSFFYPGQRTSLQFWFKPDLGNHLRDGYLGVSAPRGFDFGNPCTYRDLPQTFYNIYSPPFGIDGVPPWQPFGPRIFPLEDPGDCRPQMPPSWSRYGVYVTIEIAGSLLPERVYAFEIDVVNTPWYDFEDGFTLEVDWAFKLSIVDSFGYGRDGTYTTAAFFENENETKSPYPPTLRTGSLVEPIFVKLDEMQPYVFRPYLTRVAFDNIILAQDTTAPLRIWAPEGYEWAFAAADFLPSLNGSVIIPGGAPEIDQNRSNVMGWFTSSLYKKGERYAFATFIKVPSTLPVLSGNAFFLEWGYGNVSDGLGKQAAARAPAPLIRALSDLRLETTSTVFNDFARVWIWIETVTDIGPNGTLEIELPALYSTMIFANYTIEDDLFEDPSQYCSVLPVIEYGSLPVPHDFLCRRVLFLDKADRLVLSANLTGFVAGRYVFEFNVTNPPNPVTNPGGNTTTRCGSSACVAVYSKDACGSNKNALQCPKQVILPEFNVSMAMWVHPMPSKIEPQWQWENDYWTTTPALRIYGLMDFAEIMNNSLDEKLTILRDDRPGRRNNVIIALKFNVERATSTQDLNIRAPIGWEFDSVCSFETAAAKVFPPSGLGTTYTENSGEQQRPISAWHSSAVVVQCRGDGHKATVTIKPPGLLPGRLYLAKLGLKRNPMDTPWRRNTWSFTYGSESSGAVDGFMVATFPGAKLDPIMLAWSNKADPLAVPVGLQFNITTDLFQQTIRGMTLLPMIRITMPPLFEVVIAGDNQDIQGGDCFVMIQMQGTCKMCGIPFPSDAIKCNREWNRKNVAEITLLNSEAWLWLGITYKMWITVYNPSVPDADETSPRDWLMESFLGKPVPFATAPNGYALDTRDVRGYKISNRAELTVQEPAERNGSAYVPPQEFTMAFPEMLSPGDIIELRAPEGYMTSHEVGLLVVSVECWSFEYLPVIWPTDEEMKANPDLRRPPKRPPIPPILPAWAEGALWRQDLPLVLPPKCVEVTNMTDNSSLGVTCSNVTADDYQEAFEADGLLEWAMPLALAAQQRAQQRGTGKSSNANASFLTLRRHCISNPDVLTDLMWGSLPDWAVVTLTVNGSKVANRTGEDIVIGPWAYNQSDPSYSVEMCVLAEWLNRTSYVQLANTSSNCKRSCWTLANCTEGKSRVRCLSNATWNVDICLGTCAFTMPLERLQRCGWVPANLIPPNSTAVGVHVVDWPTCQETCCQGTSLEVDWAAEAVLEGSGQPKCNCETSDVLLIEVLWSAASNSSTNLTQELEVYRRAYEAAVELQHWDTFPLQAQPICQDNTWIFKITADDVHPQRDLLNNTVIRMLIAYQNPIRPPMWFMNYWTVKHVEATGPVPGFVASSAAVAGWVVVSKLRYVVVELLNEVLLPDDPATLHVEFVTVNPADNLKIIGIFPDRFNFSVAYIVSRSNETAYNPRLYWDGFTEVEVRNASGTEINIKVDVDSVQYVRFRLGGVRLPWNGGQALFNLFSSMRDIPRDEMQLCCPPGYPPSNPGEVFYVPNRFLSFAGYLTNQYMENRKLFPIASSFENRLDEQDEATFRFFLPAEFRTTSQVVLVIRPPRGYIILPKDFQILIFATSANASASLYYGFSEIDYQVRQLNETRAELYLSSQVLPALTEIRVIVEVQTPKAHSKRTDRRLWVFELTDGVSMDAGIASPNLGTLYDFALYGQVNFTINAGWPPPEVVVEVAVTFTDFGEWSPNRIEVYGPNGFQFLTRCMSPNNPESIQNYFVSCNERWGIWNGNYLSGAIIQTVTGGIPRENLPVTLRLMALTPPQTPEINSWYVRSFRRDTLFSWGIQQMAFPIIPMDANVAYAATAGTRVPIFLAIRVRVNVPYGGLIHFAAPRLYQLFCPVTKVLNGPFKPACSQDDPTILTGCWGLPSPNDPNPPFGLPLCYPTSELLLVFTREAAGLASNSSEVYAMKSGDSLFLSLEVRVPMSTPTPRTENVFRIRLLDENKIQLDGKLTEFGAQVSEVPRAEDFKLWWTRALPNSIISVAVHFIFNYTLPRNQEVPSQRIRVIMITAPEGLKMAVRRPRDVVPLTRNSPLAITVWNWTGTMPRGLWFGLDESKNVTGVFNYAFPVFLPGAGELPYDNLWSVKLCADSPFCETQLLEVPMPGFFFGEEPDYELSEEAFSALMGSNARRRGALRLGAAWLWLIAFFCLLASPP